MFNREIQIGLADISDANEIAELSRDFIETGLGWSWTPSRIAKSIRKRSVNAVVAKKGRTLIGFGIMRYEDEKANLDLLAVKRGFRRQGVGSSIVEWLEEVASVAGIFHIYVQLRKSNSVAEKFYSKLGFEVVSVVPGFYRRLESGMVMYKDTRLLEKV